VSREVARAIREHFARTAPGTAAHLASKRLATVSRSVVEDGVPVARIFYFHDGTFLFLDAAAPDDPADYEYDLSVACLHRLLELGGEELGRGMDVARQAGEARYLAGAWTGAAG
jgi:hypothetical protein